MVTVLPTELRVVEILSVTERCAISMTKERPMASPRMRMIDIALVALRKALRTPLDRAFTCYSSVEAGSGAWSLYAVDRIALVMRLIPSDNLSGLEWTLPPPALLTSGICHGPLSVVKLVDRIGEYPGHHAA